MIMLDALSRVERMHERCGERTCSLLCQADVRARLEEMPRMTEEFIEPPLLEELRRASL